MPFQTGLANALRKRGLKVEEYRGWTTRGSSNFTPKVAVAHWTAGPCKAIGRPSLNVCVNGRSGLPGPLCNVYLDRKGIAVVVAAGKANHAGLGGWKGTSGNSNAFGCEAECCRDGDWTPEQRTEYPKVMAAFCDLMKRDSSWVCGHNEWAPTRKIDIRDWDMPRMRSQVGVILRGAHPVLPKPPIPPAGVKPTRSQVMSLPTLKQGNSGQYVRNLQGLLVANREGDVANANAFVDGNFGSGTTTVLKKYQSRVGLPADGICGPNTWVRITGVK